MKHLTPEAYDLIKGCGPGEPQQCFGDAIRHTARTGHDLVHGQVKDKETGSLLVNSHAWNVDPKTGDIHDKSASGHTLRTLLGGGGEYVPEHRYTERQAMHLVTGTGKKGPWTDDERSRHKPKST